MLVVVDLIEEDEVEEKTVQRDCCRFRKEELWRYNDEKRLNMRFYEMQQEREGQRKRKKKR